MAWSLKGADNMARIRAIKANGEQVREHCIALRCTPFLRQLKPKIALVFIKHLVFMLLPGTCYNIPPV